MTATTDRAGSAACLLLLVAACNAGFAVLIDVPSTEDPSLVRVRPGDPAQSYL